VAAELHLAENALALHLLLQRLEGLVDIVVANENLQTDIPSLLVVGSGLELSSGTNSRNCGRISAGPRAFTRTEGESPRYLGAGSPRQAFPERQSSQKNPHGPQPARLRPSTAKSANATARFAIRNPTTPKL
jgi:hypothetical protein